jgi:general secretion pathway protein A
MQIMYNEHFGFTESPFKVTPDPQFFFVNSCYEEAFATLRYGIETRKGFIVVTGDAGTGKTTLVKKLVCSFEPNVHTACIYDPRLSFVELIQRALKDFGLPSSSGNRLAVMGQITYNRIYMTRVAAPFRLTIQ